jgi:hypothetical protein
MLNEDTHRGAAARWLAFVGLPIANGEERNIGGLLMRGIPWFVDSLAALEPVVLVLPVSRVVEPRSRDLRVRFADQLPLTQTERALVMQQAISSVLVCLRRLPVVVLDDRSRVVDLLLERGHAWLGEPLALSSGIVSTLSKRASIRSPSTGSHRQRSSTRVTPPRTRSLTSSTRSSSASRPAPTVTRSFLRVTRPTRPSLVRGRIPPLRRGAK